MSELPQNWAPAYLGDLVRIIRGVSYKKEDATDHEIPGFLPILRATNINGFLTFDQLVWVPKKYVDDEQMLRPGDIVIAASSGSASVVGKAAQLREPWQGSFGAFCMGLRPGKQLNELYISYYLQTSEYRHLVSSLAAGVNINNLRRQHIEKIEIPVAPRPEQDRIVAEIEKQFTRLDDAVAALNRVQANLKRYRASVLKAACEGRLVPTEAELARKERRDYEPAGELLKRILAKRRGKWEADQLQKMLAAGRPPKGGEWKKNYKEPRVPNISVLPDLPEGWAWATWDQVGLSQNGRPFPSKEYRSGGVKLLRPGNLYANGRVEWTQGNTRFLPPHFEQENPDLIVAAHELIINLTAQSLKDEFLGRVCLTSNGEHCLLNQRLARLTPLLVSRRYMLWMFKSQIFRRFVDGLNTGSLIQHMFTSQLASFLAPIPPLAEQRRIADAVEEKLSSLEHLDLACEQALSRASGLRGGILRAAFSGKLAPQDLSDEPASVLLQRIRAERANAQAAKDRTPTPKANGRGGNGQHRRHPRAARARK